MKKFKLWLSTFCLALAMAFVNLQPVQVFANDSDDPQGTSQKKSAPGQSGLSPEMIMFLMMMMRMF